MTPNATPAALLRDLRQRTNVQIVCAPTEIPALPGSSGAQPVPSVEVNERLWFSLAAGLTLTVGFAAVNVIAFQVISPQCPQDADLGCGFALLGLIAIAPLAYLFAAAWWSFVVGHLRRRRHPETRSSWALMGTTAWIASAWLLVVMLVGQFAGSVVVWPWLVVQALVPVASTWWWTRPTVPGRTSGQTAGEMR
jgi:hypothetical protein